MTKPQILGGERVFTILPDGRRLEGTATGVIAGRILMLLDEPYETEIPDPYADHGKEKELVRVPVRSIEVHARDLQFLDVRKDDAQPSVTYAPPPADPVVEAEEAAARVQVSGN